MRDYADGIDLSAAMAAKLRANPGGDQVAVTMGDFAGVPVTGGVRLYPIVCRYRWPAELDLMARIAGLRLSERWGGWNREPFTSDSRLHVSVYAR